MLVITLASKTSTDGTSRVTPQIMLPFASLNSQLSNNSGIALLNVFKAFKF